MKNFVVTFLIITISVVSSKPIEENNGQVYDPNQKQLIFKRQLPDVTTLNKQFFDNIFQATRISRDTNDVNAVPTIALSDLINSVEHTLIHSAQNLAASNATQSNANQSNANQSNANQSNANQSNATNNSTTTASESDTSNVSNIQHIVLPITIPTPAPQTNEFVTETVDTTTVAADQNEDEKEDEKEDDEESVRDNRSSEKVDSEHKEVGFESVKRIESSNLDDEDDDKEVPVTEETKVADQQNITILQTINSTQTIPTQSDVFHVHQQQITLFSANAGVFPNIHAFKAEDLPVLAQTVQTSTAEPELNDCSGEETSDESSGDDVTSSPEDQSSSSFSSEEKEKVKKDSCSHIKSSVATSKTVESSTPSIEAMKKIKTEELKEKIAEVEADPVILTQGI